jgi:hypothetical protein
VQAVQPQKAKKLAREKMVNLPVTVANFFGIVKTAAPASQGFCPFDRTGIVIRRRIAAL